MRDEQGAGARPSRRAFLRAGVGALLIGPDELAVLVASLSFSVQPGTLGSRTQYLSDAAEFETAMSGLASAVRLSVDTDAALTRFTSQVATAGAKLDRSHSWMVARCLADANLERWVRATVRDETSFKALVASLNRSPKALDHVPEVAALRRRLGALRAEKIAIVQQVIAKERETAGIEAVGTSAARKAADAAECEQTWAIVTATLVIVVTTIAAIATTVTSAASTLSATYRGTGADLAYATALSANRSYQQCVDVAATLPSARRPRAIAACQARWLEEKAANVL